MSEGLFLAVLSVLWYSVVEEHCLNLPQHSCTPDATIAWARVPWLCLHGVLGQNTGSSARICAQAQQQRSHKPGLGEERWGVMPLPLHLEPCPEDTQDGSLVFRQTPWKSWAMHSRGFKPGGPANIAQALHLGCEKWGFKLFRVPGVWGANQYARLRRLKPTLH